MRAILHGFHEAMHLPILERVVADLGIDYCQIIHASLRPTLPKTVEVVLHHFWDLNWGDYHVDWNQLHPLDEELLGRLADAEVVFLKMADRLEQALPQSYQQRKNLYLKHVRYWNHVLLEQKIDVYLGLNVPHETFDWIIYALCKLHGISTLFFFQSQVADTVLPMEDWESAPDVIGRRHRELALHHAATPDAQIVPSGRFLDDFDKQTAAKKPTPFYMNAPATTRPPSLRPRVRQVLRAMRHDPSLVRDRLLHAPYWVHSAKRLYEARERALLDQQALAAYEAVAVEPDLERRFIYLALHYQPEMTSSPLAGAFVDQVLIAQLLAATMPEDCHLYIKEHPAQKKLLGRYVGYYDELARLPRTRLIKKSFDTFELSSRSAAVATATGTVGWEALYRGTPVLLFGHTFYQAAPAVFSIHSVDDCRSAMEQIFVKGVKPTLRDMRLFLRALEDTTVECYLSPEYAAISRLSPEQNQRNVIAALNAGVERLVSRRSRP